MSPHYGDPDERPLEVAHTAGPPGGRGQRCVRCGWEVPQPSSHFGAEANNVPEGVDVECRRLPSGYDLTVLEIGDVSPLPHCRPASE